LNPNEILHIIVAWVHQLPKISRLPQQSGVV